MNHTITALPAGEVLIPPSKSLSHRALIAAALAAENGPCTVQNLGDSQDIEATRQALKALHGAATGPVDCAESGSTLRFLIPLAALAERETVFTGRGRLLQRPLDIYRELLPAHGASFEQRDGTVRVGGRLRSGRYPMPGDVSSQFLSGLLFALPLLDGDSEIVLTSPLESSAYVDMTLDVLRHYGVQVEAAAGRYHIPGGQRYRPADYTVEGDYSQAAFFLGAAALGRPVTCRGLRENSLQGDRQIVDILRRMGAAVTREGDVVRTEARQLMAVNVDARQIPDLIPPVAALCCFCMGESHITGAGRLRIKESDRLHALAAELGRLGANIEEGADSLTIRGKPMLEGGAADAHGDHRIAMTLAMASICCRNPVTIAGAKNVAKSYPRFWDDFEKEARRYGE